MQTVKNGIIRFTDAVTQHDRQEPEADGDKRKADREHGKGDIRTGDIGLCEESPAVFQQGLDTGY